MALSTTPTTSPYPGDLLPERYGAAGRDGVYAVLCARHILARLFVGDTTDGVTWWWSELRAQVRLYQRQAEGLTHGV